MKLEVSTVPSININIVHIGMKVDQILPLPYPNPLFFIGFGAERIIHGCGCECGFFGCQEWCGAELDRIWIQIVK